MLFFSSKSSPHARLRMIATFGWLAHPRWVCTRPERPPSYVNFAERPLESATSEI
jgi:hypothetical protein